MSTWSELKFNPRLKKIFDERSLIVKTIREFFWREGFVEAETPLALRYAGQEPYLNPVPLKIHSPAGEEFELLLRTSPEFSLKKLLAAGNEKVFELGKCFRNFEDLGGQHSPEFTMLEWYRAPGALEDIMDDVEKLFQNVLLAIGKQKIVHQQKEISVFEKWDRVSMRELFLKHLKVDLNEYLKVEQIRNLAKEKGYQINENDEYEDLFFKLFLNEIEPNLGWEKPVFVYDYPARMCSLSKTTADPRYAKRFELYIGGMELANAFGELVDAGEQRNNLEKDKLLREKLGKTTWPVDPEFIAALKSGVPGGEAGGIALGVDRMVVLCTGANNINEVIFTNIKDQFLN